MYQSHWGLRETPFRSGLDSQFFHQSPTHEEALARLHFLVEERRRLGLLLGGVGSGKSFLLEVFSEEMRRSGRAVAKLSLLGLEPPEMLWQLAAAMDLCPDWTDRLPLVWRSITDRITEYRYQRLQAVVLFDDADRAAGPVLAQVARLAELDPSADSPLTIVVAAREGQLDKLGRELLELADLRIDLETWEQADTESYLAASLARAGRQSPVFDRPAVTRLHQLAGGVPRRIARLADLALLAGAGQDLQQIDAKLVESAHEELDSPHT